MGFNFGTRHLTGQQQAIIRQREKEDEIRERESKKKVEISCMPIPNYGGQYEAVVFKQDGRTLLELRVSKNVIDTLELEGKTTEWLENIGSKQVKPNQPHETVLITSYNIENGKLATEWEKLKRV